MKAQHSKERKPASETIIRPEPPPPPTTNKDNYLQQEDILRGTTILAQQHLNREAESLLAAAPHIQISFQLPVWLLNLGERKVTKGETKITATKIHNNQYMLLILQVINSKA
eukprot:6634055-Ditylum_brightwellii.AAC.1